MMEDLSWIQVEPEDRDAFRLNLHGDESRGITSLVVPAGFKRVDILNCRHLRELDVLGSPKNIRVRSCPSLTSFHIEDWGTPSPTESFLGDPAIDVTVEYCERIEELYFPFRTVSATLSNCAKLKTLVLPSRFRGLRAEGLKALTCLETPSSLEAIKLDKCPALKEWNMTSAPTFVQVQDCHELTKTVMASKLDLLRFRGCKHFSWN